jgi:hypothetical protein
MAMEKAKLIKRENELPLKIQKELENVTARFREYEAETRESQYDREMGDVHNAEELGLASESIVSNIDVLVESIAATLEARNLTDTRKRFLDELDKFKVNGTYEHDYDERFDVVDCPAFKRILTYLNGALAVSPEESSEQMAALERLEKLLEDTSYFVGKFREEPPKNEADIQHAMHLFLQAAFPGFVKKPTISNKPLKKYHPDGGVPSLGAAVEFKFVDSVEELNQAVDGIYSDMNGYAGSKDWRLFYAVLYLTQDFRSKAAIQQHLEFEKKTNWKIIVVRGPGAREKRVET